MSEKKTLINPYLKIPSKEESHLDDLTKKNIEDITNAVLNNLGINDSTSLVAAYYGLVAVMSYIDYRMRDNGITDAVIEQAKINAESYVLGLISEELGVAIPQKKGLA